MSAALTTVEPLPWIYDDGGRSAAGFRGDADDCVTRAIAIALDLPYREVYDELHEQQRVWLASRRKRRSGTASPRGGVYREVFGPWLAMVHDWTFTPTMSIGSGCRYHLAVGELPIDRGPLITNLSKHVAAALPGDHPRVYDRRYGPSDLVLLDNHDPTREGTRCVYGYWSSAP